MIKLAKYLKAFYFGLILAIALLLVQALCDLNLPNYMSEIVNVGIQQNGIERAAPDAVSQQGMKLISTFMNDGEKQLIDENYALVSPVDLSEDGTAYSSVYPKATAPFYIKLNAGGVTADGLDRAFGTAALTMVGVMQDMAKQPGQSSQPGQSGQSGQPGQSLPSGQSKQAGTSAPGGNFDITALYQLQPMLDRLPEAAFAGAREKAASNSDAMLNQSGIMLTKSFYKELGVNIGGIQTAYIIRIGLIMLGIALLGGLATVLVSLLSSRIAAGVSRNLRKDMFGKIESFSNNEFDQFSTASLITRCTNDITQIQQLLMMGIRMICYAPILGVGGIIMAIKKSYSMSWIIAVACIALIGMIMVIMTIAMPKFKAIQKMVDKLNLVARENLSGMMVIRAFDTQEHERERFETANGNLTRTNLFVNRVMVFMMPAMTLIMNGVTLLILWVGAHQIVNSAMQVGDMMAFMQYAMQIIMAFLMISMMFILVPRAAVSAARIAEVLGTEDSIKDPKNPKEFDPAMKGFVEFRHVFFRYRDAEEDALSDITFTARPGQTTAIIGSTGSGKTTIVNMILRFYDAGAGQILVDGADVREVSQKALRGRIGYVPQKGALLSGTIAFNLRYGKRDASDSDLETAAKVAQALEFISEKPEGFDAAISQGGTNVSGGQKQRLSIARALAKKPEILIFDDSFSALDYRTDAALRKALKEQTGDSAVITVAQRVSTIMNAEQILVLDEGRIVGRGTHKELLKNCPQYYEIASSQLSQEELA